VLFFNIFDVNIKMGRMSVGRTHAPVAIDLPFEVVAATAWDALFRGEAISVW